MKKSPNWIVAAKTLVALRFGTVEDLNLVLESGVDADLEFKIGNVIKPAIHIAVERASVDLLELLLNHGASPNRCDSQGRTALHVAIDLGCEPCVEVLLSRRCCVKGQDSQGRSPLHYAVHKGSLRISQLLIQNGASISQQAYDGQTPLSYLASSSNVSLELLQLLFQNGAQHDDLDHAGCSVIAHLINSPYTYDMLEFLLRYGAECRMGPLHRVILSNNREKCRCVELLLKFGADVNVTTLERQTPLHFAVKMGDIPSAAILLRAGADPNTSDCLGLTPLSYALTTRGLFGFALMLLDAGARLNPEQFAQLKLNHLTTNQRAFIQTLANVPTLKHLCRTTIWKLTGGHGAVNWASTTQIPRTLKYFLGFDYYFKFIEKPRDE